jgi:hypothetical protein
MLISGSGWVIPSNVQPFDLSNVESFMGKRNKSLKLAIQGALDFCLNKDPPPSDPSECIHTSFALKINYQRTLTFFLF